MEKTAKKARLVYDIDLDNWRWLKSQAATRGMRVGEYLNEVVRNARLIKGLSDLTADPAVPVANCIPVDQLGHTPTAIEGFYRRPGGFSMDDLHRLEMKFYSDGKYLIPPLEPQQVTVQGMMSSVTPDEPEQKSETDDGFSDTLLENRHPRERS